MMTILNHTTVKHAIVWGLTGIAVTMLGAFLLFAVGLVVGSSIVFVVPYLMVAFCGIAQLGLLVFWRLTINPVKFIIGNAIGIGVGMAHLLLFGRIYPQYYGEIYSFTFGMAVAYASVGVLHAIDVSSKRKVMPSSAWMSSQQILTQIGLQLAIYAPLVILSLLIKWVDYDTPIGQAFAKLGLGSFTLFTALGGIALVLTQTLAFKLFYPRFNAIIWLLLSGIAIVVASVAVNQWMQGYIKVKEMDYTPYVPCFILMFSLGVAQMLYLLPKAPLMGVGWLIMQTAVGAFWTVSIVFENIRKIMPVDYEIPLHQSMAFFVCLVPFAYATTLTMRWAQQRMVQSATFNAEKTKTPPIKSKHAETSLA
jgi:hypothetical protein